MRGYTLVVVLFLLGMGLLGWHSGAVAQRPDRPWQPAPNAPPVIAQTSSPRTHSLDAVAQPLPAAQPQPLLPVIATTAPSQPPAPAEIIRVSATEQKEKPPPDPPPQAAPEVRAAVAPPPAPAKEPNGGASAVSVEKIGPEAVNAGQPFTYEIVVRNPGKTPAQFVRVQDQLTGNVRYLRSEPKAELFERQLLWNLGTLEGGAERRIKVEVLPTGEGELLATATATCSARTSLRTRIQQPKLSIVKKGPETAQVGETVKFELMISNLGSGPVEKVLLRDLMPAGLQHPAQRSPGDTIEADLGTLAPGQSKTIDMTVKAVQAGRFVNQATVSAPGVAEASAQSAIVVTDSSLSLRMTGPQQSNPNQELEYSLLVSNGGSGPATGVKLTNQLPDGLDYLSASDGGAWNAAGRSVNWDLGTLAPGQSKAVTMRIRAVKAGDWKNLAVARTDRGQEARAEVPVHVEGVPALMLEVVDLDDPVEVGAETTYEIRVVNQGTAPCTNIKIGCVGPEGMALLGAQGPVSHKLQGNQVTFEPLPRLAAKADALFKVRARGVKPGDWRFRVSLSCDHMPRPVYEDESTQVYSDSDGPPGQTQQEINNRK